MKNFIRKARELEAGATPGPWKWEAGQEQNPCFKKGDEDFSELHGPKTTWTDAIIETDCNHYGPDGPTAELIAFTRNNWSKVLDALEMAGRQLDHYGFTEAQKQITQILEGE